MELSRVGSFQKPDPCEFCHPRARYISQRGGIGFVERMQGKRDKCHARAKRESEEYVLKHSLDLRYSTVETAPGITTLPSAGKQEIHRSFITLLIKVDFRRSERPSDEKQ